MVHGFVAGLWEGAWSGGLDPGMQACLRSTICGALHLGEGAALDCRSVGEAMVVVEQSSHAGVDGGAKDGV